MTRSCFSPTEVTVQEWETWVSWLSPLSWQCQGTFCLSTLPRAAISVCGPWERFKGRNKGPSTETDCVSHAFKQFPRIRLRW